jgi:S1-C subfamily serine protease
VAAVSGRRDALTFGATGTDTRRIDRRGGVLGVELDIENRLRDGVRVKVVHPGGGAEAAGIVPSDVIIAAAGKPVTNPRALQKIVFSRYPGDIVPLVVKREGARLELDVKLAHWTVIDRVSRLRQENIDVSGPVSRRISGFRRATQHDIPLSPREIGSPLLATDGRAIGINIARADRVTTYALPSSLVLRSLEGTTQAAPEQDGEETAPQGEHAADPPGGPAAGDAEPEP